MNGSQGHRIGTLGAESVWRIPDGSWLAVRRNERGTWIEVIDPKCSGRLAFDFARDEPLRSPFPEGAEDGHDRAQEALRERFRTERVVPCDDAAIERAALVIAKLFSPVPLDTEAINDCRSYAERVLRAAGEAP